MKIDPQEISIQPQDGEDWDFEAVWRGQRVGYAWCRLQDENLLIDDIKVEDDHRVPWSIMNAFLISLGILSRKRSFRKMGVGNRLLDQVIAKAKNNAVQNIWGSVTQDDIDRVPYLLAWYQRRGFYVTEPDDNYIKTAVKKIVMKL